MGLRERRCQKTIKNQRSGSEEAFPVHIKIKREDSDRTSDLRR
jgi:hypothetical protein